jgi:protein-tyrosine-phosphatase
MMVPRDFRGRTVDWPVEDPVGKSLNTFRRVRGELDVLVRQLVDDIRRRSPLA